MSESGFSRRTVGTSCNAQSRLDKLKEHLKTEERAKKQQQSVAKSSVAQTKKAKSNFLGSEEKREKIREELLRQARRNHGSQMRQSTCVASPLSPTTTAAEPQKRGSAQARLKKVVTARATKEKSAAPLRLEKVRLAEYPKQTSTKVENPPQARPIQARPQAVRTQPDIVSSIQDLPRSLQNYSIPKTSVTSRLSQVSSQRSKQDRRGGKQGVPYDANSRPLAELRMRMSAKGNLNDNKEVRTADQVRAPPLTRAPCTKQPNRQSLAEDPLVKQSKLELCKSSHSTKNELPQATVSNDTKKYNPQLQRNLFKRKAPRENSVGSSSEGNTGTLQQRDVPPEDAGGVKQFISKVARGVVGALKQTWMAGADRMSSFSGSRSDVSKELQNVRTLVERVEMMDYEISCPTFEEEGKLVQTDLYLVVDTNVIIDNLALIKSLKGRTVKGMTPKIIIPWQVLKELDYLKEHKQKVEDVHRSARTGIRFLLDEIIQNSGFISGQPQHVASRCEDFVVEIPDDHLIKCCLQLKWSGHSVALLTNDRNLAIKAVVTEVPAMQSNELSKLMNESNPPRPLSCFESPPSGSFPQHQLALANASHQLTVLLKNFLSAVMKKYLTLKYQGLWQLKSPGPEPWTLTVLLERADEFWNDLTGKRSSNLNATETISQLRRFISRGTYGKVRYPELDQFARLCHQLAGSLPSTFGAEGAHFDNRLSSWKYPDGFEPPADVTFVGSCVSLTVHHFQLFENNVVHYCDGLSQTLGVPFSYPKAYQTLSAPVNVALNLLPKHLSAVESIGSALERISATPVEEVSKSTETVQIIHGTLVSHLREAADPRFFVEDVIEFCKDGCMRQSIPSALNNLQILQTFLLMVSRR